MDNSISNLENWLRAHPEVGSLRVAICDLNGTFRGKRVPVSDAARVAKGDVRMPLTLAAQDIWGRDVEEDNIILEAGDADGICQHTGRDPMPQHWLARPSVMVPMWFYNADGTPSSLDPRHALARVAARATAMGLTPVIGTELEFYLMDGEAKQPTPPLSPVTGHPLRAEAVHAIDELDGFEAFFDDLYRACETMGIGSDAAVAEGSPGQFEITMRHTTDPLRAADDAIFLKRLVRGTARSHGLAASFMAKPYMEQAGNGFHLHMSMLDASGRNIFDDGTPQGAPALRHAIAGCLARMHESTLLFAPHLNSFRRLVPGGHAPTAIGWAYENRYAAIRVPGGNPRARRFEHRVAGADTNPYLVIAAILNAALEGIEAGKEPIPPHTGAPEGLQTLPDDWFDAIAAFRTDESGPFPVAMARLYAAAKRQELARFAERMSDFEVQTYLEVV
ncbi:glutamine synthetase family protein [Oceanibium sediminis]|uniref:glutamine synthetase family protein n=1 Tax=Oceanibium sediminis TaxID=2026339 RepID=UPI000DD4E3BE|nr:glutamine synthetase family protein [Oceanibium sediminis]